MKTFISTLLLLFIIFYVNAQGLVSFAEGTALTIDCDSNCTVVHAVFPHTKSSNAYKLDSITYAPTPLTTYTNLVQSDDTFSKMVGIGFPFCFYNTKYSTLCMSTNGILTFNSTYANLPSTFNTFQPLPFVSPTFPDKSIFGPFVDMAYGPNSTIHYGTVGTTPFRKFIVEYSNMRLFSAICSTKLCTFQIELNEYDNAIEMHILKKDTCAAGGLGSQINYGIIGIQGTGLTYTVAPGKNGTVWAMQNKAYKFTPNGTQNYTLQWYVNGVASPAISDTLKVCNTNFPIQVALYYNQQCPLLSDSAIIDIKHFQPPISSVNISSLPLCPGMVTGSFTVTATSPNPPVQYSINNGVNWNSNGIFNGLSVASYTVIVKDAAGCSNASKVVLPSVSGMSYTLDTIHNTPCIPDSSGYLKVTASNGVAPYTYMWNTGVVGQVLANVSNGSYTVTITDNIGCTIVGNEFIVSDPIKVSDTITSAGCGLQNGSIKLQGVDGISPYYYIWDWGDTAQNLFNLKGDTTYNVKVIDAQGCFKNFTIFVPQLSLGIIGTIVTKPTCDKNNGSIALVMNTGVPPFTFAWTNGATTQTITGVDSGYYGVSVSDSLGCNTYLGINIKDTLEMETYPSKTNPKCGLSNGIINIAPWNGKPPYTYSWSTGATSATIASLNAGQYICTTTDALNCIKKDTFNLVNAASPSIIYDLKNAHCDTFLGNIQIDTLNFKKPVTIAWSNGYNNIPLSNAMPGSYTLTISDAAGCSVVSTFTILNSGSPHALITDYYAPLCAGDSSGKVTLVGIGGLAPYKYSIDGITFSTNANIYNIASGTYKIFIKDDYACVRDTTIIFGANSNMIITTSVLDTIFCNGDPLDSVRIFATNGYSPYSYNLDGKGFQSSNFYAGLNVGTHSITVSDSATCKKSFILTVPGPDSVLHPTIITTDGPCGTVAQCAMRATTVGGWPPYYYTWSNNVSNIDSIKNLMAGTYTVTVRDFFNCEASSNALVKQLNCCTVWVPGAFSPTGEDINRQLHLKSTALFTSFNFSIYNRHGQQVFATTDINKSWDGNLDGEPMAMDNYYYYLTFSCPNDDNIIKQKGDVFLLR